MKFENLLFFYAVMNLRSNSTETANLRKNIKSTFIKICKQDNTAILSLLPIEDNHIKRFLGALMSHQSHFCALISVVTHEIKENQNCVRETIEKFSGENSEDLIDYLNQQLELYYPEINEDLDNFNRCQVKNLQENATLLFKQKKEISEPCLQLSKIRENETIERQTEASSEKNEKNCCRII